MRIVRVEGSELLARAAATRIAQSLRIAVGERGRAAVAFSGGRTPRLVLAALAATPLPWESVHVFKVDERVAPDGHLYRNSRDLVAELVDRQPTLSSTSVHLMDVTAWDLDAAAVAYAAELGGVCGTPPVVDLVHLGLGDDGHTASLPPGTPSSRSPIATSRSPASTVAGYG